jgi:flagellar hook-length control protein FliK
MNAAILAIRTPVVAVPQQAPPQESSQNAATSADPTAGASGARNFAGALDRASGKHSRKDDSAKPGAGKPSGDALPPSGSVAPPASATPVAAPPLPAPLLGSNAAPVASSSLDEGGDSDEAAPPLAGPAPAGAASVVTPDTALSSASTGVDPSVTDPAPAAGSQQVPTGAEGAVFSAATTNLDSTAADAEIATNGAAPTTAAAGTAQSSDGSAAATAAAQGAASSAPATPIGGVRATASTVSGPRLQAPSSGSGAAGSSAGRAVAQTAPPAATSTAPADDSAAAAQTPVASNTLIDLALVEGSDATGSAASALQAANAAASTPAPAADATAAAASPFTPLPISMTPIEGAGSVSSATALDTAALTSAAVVSLGSGGDARGHNGAGNSGSDTGSGSLANGDGAAALQQLSTSATSSSRDAAPVPTVSVHADVDSADFPQGVADKVFLAVDNGWSSAKLSVNPPQLGPIELQIAVQGAHAQIAMSTHSAVTREALESSMPRLRDMLNSQGFTQVSVDISQRSFQERSAPELPYSRTSGGARETAAVSSSSAQVSRAPLGMLDTYA